MDGTGFVVLSFFSLDGNTIISELIALQSRVKNCPCGKKTKITLLAPGFLAGVVLGGGGVFSPPS